MKRILLHVMIGAMFLWSGLSMEALADSITLTLNDPSQTANPGAALTYSATISAPLSNSAPVYLNADSVTFAGPANFVIDDSPFAGNFPLYLIPGQSETNVLFSVSLPFSALTGMYDGFFVIQGGADDNAQDILDSGMFTVDVTPSEVIPEPSSWLLLLSGVLGMVAIRGIEQRLGIPAHTWKGRFTNPYI